MPDALRRPIAFYAVQPHFVGFAHTRFENFVGFAHTYYVWWVCSAMPRKRAD